MGMQGTCQAGAHRPLCVPPPSRKTSLFYPLSPKSSGRLSEPTPARGYDLCSQSSMARNIAIQSEDPIQVYRGQSLPEGLGQKTREWAGVTSVVPACCQLFEEVMSLNTIWLDTGMSGLCGFQTGGEQSSIKSRNLGPLFSKSERAGQSEAGFSVLWLPS